MRLFHSRHLIRATIAVILGVAIASCKGGPVSPTETAIQLSHTTLVFTHSTQQQVTITNLETETIDWRVLSSTASWLSAAPGSGTIGPRGSGTLTVQIDRQAVPQGSHSASLQVGAGGSSIALNVSVVTQAAAQAGLQPQALSFAPSESSRSIEVVNSGGSTLDWTLSGPEWATFSPSSGSLAPGGRRQVTVTALRTGLSGGVYQGTLRLNSNGGSPTADLTLDVAGVSGLRVDPATLDFGTAGSEATLRVTNDTDRSLSWTAQPGGPWISLSSTSGQLPPRLSQVLTVQVTRGGLSHGTNQAPILFSTSGGATSASVKATIEPANNPNPSSSGQAKIDVTPTSLDFGAGTTELRFQIFNDGDQPLEWSAVPQASWIKLPLGSGRVSPHSSAVVTVQVTRAGLTAGTYQSTVRFTSSVGTVTAAIAATVSPVTTPPPSTPPPSNPPPSNPPPSNPPTEPAPAKVVVSPTTLQFSKYSTELAFTVQNTGGSSLSWSAQPSNAWVTMPTSAGSVAPGATQQVVVRVDRTGLAASGTYQGSIQLTSNGGSATVFVTLQVPGPSDPPEPPPAKIGVSPTSLDFGLTSTEKTFTLQNTGGSTLSWTAQSSDSPVTLPTSAGQVAGGGSQSVTVRVSRTGLTGGTYNSSVQLSSNGGSATVSVTFEVPAQSPPPPPPSGGNTVNVKDYGAKGDGVTDDAPAFDAAIKALPASGGTVTIPTGTYLLRAISAGPNRQIDIWKRANVTLAGAGMDHTILKMAPAVYNGAVFTIRIGFSSNVTIKDLAIDGNPANVSYYDEQSHSIRIMSSTDVRVERVRFSGSGGDAIQLIGIGEAGEPWTERVWIENSHITYTRRNGISIQRGVRDLVIRENTFERVSQQPISSEPSGSNASMEILIEDNLIRHASAAWAIALAGIAPADGLKNVTFRHNTVENGALYVLFTNGLVVEGNTIQGERYHSPMKLHDVSNAVVTGNTIIAVEGSSEAIQVFNYDNHMSEDVTIQDNVITVASGLNGIQVRDALKGIAIQGNSIRGTNGNHGLIVTNLLVQGRTRSEFELLDNLIEDFETSIEIHTQGDKYANMAISQNTMTSDLHQVETVGILFKKTGPYSQFATVTNNTFGSGIDVTILLVQ